MDVQCNLKFFGLVFASAGIFPDPAVNPKPHAASVASFEQRPGPVWRRRKMKLIEEGGVERSECEGRRKQMSGESIKAYM